MINDKRRFNIADVSSAHELAEKLGKHTWTLCTGFRFKGYLFLNDSFSEDGAMEFAVVREADGVQVESITFGWCSEAEALSHIKLVTDRHGGDMEYGTVEVREHGKGESCRLCA
jgi:hypothetical protein